MSKAAAIKTHEHKLSLGEILRWLVQDWLVAKDAAERLYQDHKNDAPSACSTSARSRRRLTRGEVLP